MDLDALHADSDGLIPGELASVPRRLSTQQIHNPLDLFLAQARLQGPHRLQQV